MYSVRLEKEHHVFSAAHFITYSGDVCERLHGHNYRVQVTLAGPELDSIGLLVDFTELKRVLRGIISGLDHQFLNDLDAFKTVNPSAENLAKYFYDETDRQLMNLPAGAGITEVTVWETDTSSAQFRPGK